MKVKNKLETKIWVLCSSALAMTMLVCGAAQSSIREKDLDQDLQDLVRTLRSIDYNIRFEKTPIPGKYGLTNAKNKTIWVAPITIEMGIFRKTLIHEAVHAVQSCQSGKFIPIGWELTLAQSLNNQLNLIYI